ncbi:signal peptidase I [Sphaerisporangium fuscum]|uniref:signal peptidase I n=1 Tax=Sphaerisporangium fuscum TaxID=2835868 RepID=UPI001BDBF93E|nr:signal peptidase I [Sphaerisporangium fuscum]
MTGHAKLLLPAFGVVAVGASLLWLRRRYMVATVRGPSMEPTLRSGDRLLVRRTKRVHSGQIVVVRIPDPPAVEGLPPGVEPGEEDTVPEMFDHPGRRLLVKRAVAVAGEPVPRESFPALRDVSETVVPEDALVVLGDNPDTSWDSREFGFVRGAEFVGVMVRRLPRE